MGVKYHLEKKPVEDNWPLSSAQIIEHVCYAPPTDADTHNSSADCTHTQTSAELHHLRYKLTNDVDINEKRDALMKVTNDARHWDMTLMPL